MKVLLMRHGEAVEEAAGGDGERWLTGKGREVTRQVAQHLCRHTCPVTVWTSPLVRAVQTAEIVASAAGIDERLTVCRELATGAVKSLHAQIEAFHGDGPLLLVGHEPTLSALAMDVLEMERWPGFKKSGVLALARDKGHKLRFEWLLIPRHLRVVDRVEDLFA